MGLSQAWLAKLCGVSKTTVNNWANKKSKTPKIVFEYLALVSTIRDIKVKVNGSKKERH